MFTNTFDSDCEKNEKNRKIDIKITTLYITFVTYNVVIFITYYLLF